MVVSTNPDTIGETEKVGNITPSTSNTPPFKGEDRKKINSDINVYPKYVENPPPSVIFLEKESIKNSPLLVF